MIHPQAVVITKPFTVRVDNYKLRYHRGVNPLAEAICAIPRSMRIDDVTVQGSMTDHLTDDTLVKGELVCWRWFREEQK